MLKIKNLHIKAANKEILRSINLEIKAGEIHVIMGPNGSGKSTLANVLAGKENFEYVSGTVEYFGENLLTLLPEERANRGLFLAFQYPVEIAGINNMYFLKTALNTLRKYNKQPELDAFDFMSLIKSKCKIVEIDESFLQRSVNTGFSGGEKKRNEILQMLVLEPKLAILDEPDSGLDIDALRLVAKGINTLRDPERSIILVTHYQRLLDYVTPDYIHILHHGQIVQSGTKELAQELEQKGYGWITEEK
ncbi:MAG: Fe-S cluster assembly ATPase SufC [bacterium]